ncbi:MAG: retroviral-like aspartic protease [Candidatus Diapherotrites archaeon]|jgi:hypothetical protein|uniref:Retroviral-like aspartic protease n=1 Tax=Candidatus Iainarchaeum sp. TaxID=3101447 RepID=A0A7K4BYK4_9ARCH|nr:retroviral-like aspartic protease [Candidatus Diapherotrites archaeon]
MDKRKKLIGLVEVVEIFGSKGSVKKRALFDTGATRSCVDVKVAAKAGIGPIVSSVRIKSASAPKGYTRRAIAEAVIRIKDKEVKARVNIEDREGLPYSVLIGRDIIHENFLIDVSKSNKSIKSIDLREREKNEYVY